MDLATEYGLPQSLQPTSVVHGVLTTPFPEEYQEPEEPDNFLPAEITWTDLTADDHKKLIQWRAQAGRKIDLVNGFVLKRLKMLTVPKAVKKVGQALSQREQRVRAKRGMFNNSHRTAQHAKKAKSKTMPKQVRETYDKLTDLQLLYVSRHRSTHNHRTNKC